MALGLRQRFEYYYYYYYYSLEEITSHPLPSTTSAVPNLAETESLHSRFTFPSIVPSHITSPTPSVTIFPNVEESNIQLIGTIVAIAAALSIAMIVVMIFSCFLFIRRKLAKLNSESPPVFYETISRTSCSANTAITTTSNTAYSSHANLDMSDQMQNPGEVTTVVWNIEYGSASVADSVEEAPVTKEVNDLDNVVMMSSVQSTSLGSC